jgi:hypothetical protein
MHDARKSTTLCTPTHGILFAKSHAAAAYSMQHAASLLEQPITGKIPSQDAGEEETQGKQAR